MPKALLRINIPSRLLMLQFVIEDAEKSESLASFAILPLASAVFEDRNDTKKRQFGRF